MKNTSSESFDALPSSRRRRAWRKPLTAVSLLAILLAAPALAFADEAADVSKHLRAGQLADAMNKADAFLAQHPRDAQMRFLKGVILTEQNKQVEAIAVFTRLTEDYPDLPEPYNNLAVLHAAFGQYDKARTALENAIRTNPTYATAYENLGDVHAKLASQAYDKALQLDSGNSTAKSKLTMLRSLTVAAGKPAAGQQASSASSASAMVAAPTAVPPTPIKPTSGAAETKQAAKPAAKSANDDENDQNEVLNVVYAWARAWSAKDVKGYLNFYANDFQTPNGESHKAWAAMRESRIAGKGRISVKIEAPRVSIDGNTATVKFRQNYASDHLKADSSKMLMLIKQGGKWHIKQERTG